MIYNYFDSYIQPLQRWIIFEKNKVTKGFVRKLKSS